MILRNIKQYQKYHFPLKEQIISEIVLLIKKQNLNILKTENFDDLLDFWQKKKSPCDENFLEKTVVLDRLIIMDDISGLADRSEAFANILTVSKNLV